MKLNFPNIINKDGHAHYYGTIMNTEENHYYFNELFHKIDWVNENVMMFGKEIVTKRKVAFYADKGINYTYSHKTKKSSDWTPLLLDLKQLVSDYTQSNYNACLLNLYHNGEEGMGWHSDNEKEIIPNSSIASISIGEARKFSFKHKTTKESQSILLENGSLLEMTGCIQQHWLHALPKSKKAKGPRINLTFRQMVI